MARPKQDGLKYFSFDTDFFYSDRRIRALISRYECKGIVLYIYLLTEIYRNGYFARWDEDIIDGAISLGLTEGLIEQVMTFLIGRSLLTKSILANSDAIITSPGIQKRYQEAAKSLKRDVFVQKEIWLLSEEETAPYIKFTINDSKSEKNDSKSEKNDSKSEKNKAKEIKRKEIKEKENKEEYLCTELDEPAPTSNIKIPLNDKTFYDVPLQRIEEWKEVFPAVCVEEQLKRMVVWCNANPSRKKTRRGIERFITNWLSREQDRGGRYCNTVNNKDDLEEWANG